MYPRCSSYGRRVPAAARSALWLSAMVACSSPDLPISEPDPPADLAPVARAQPTPAVARPGAPLFTLFETGQVRPLAMSPDRRHLFAVNTPDNRLEVFRIHPHRLIPIASIPVGLEPVAVAVRSDREVWVVNHLSDSVSVIELDDDGAGRVVRTLLVGDEPRDVVFAGPQRRRAFITTAHRGQNIPFDPQLTTPGVGRADVWVFDAGALGDRFGGTPLTIVSLFADTPRALAVTPDGTRVYVAGFQTGNQTSSVSEPLIPNGFGPDGVPGPATNFEGVPAPEVGQIVKWNGSHWVDAGGTVRDDLVRLALPDKDVFVLDAMADPPRQLDGPAGFFQHVGTILYSMIVNPVSGKVYVANTDANNLERFEGPGSFAGHSLRGHLHENRITVLTPGDGGVAPRHLNKHIDYSKCCAPVPNAESTRSLALPQGMAVTRNGATLYVAALGSDKVGVFSTAALETDAFVPDAASHIHVSGGGPTGLVLDEDQRQLFVLTRFDDAISIIDTSRRTEVAHVAMHNPEPPTITAGRRFLYDAALSSSHGDSACASCHVFGDFDSLAWDLGNPDAPATIDPGPFRSALINIRTGGPFPTLVHPMKGPMTTQSLRGMLNAGPMHWRGDRTGAHDAPSVQPDSGAFDERAAFAKFQAGFTDLLGRNAPIPVADMDAFTDFILQVTYPPNPIRALDNTLTPDQEAGHELFEITNCGIPAPPGANEVLNCSSCHTLDPSGNPGTARPGFFGTSGLSSTAGSPSQLFKVPQLRNLYQKIGMFGTGPNANILTDDTGFKGDQVRGFGFLHDGNIDTVFRFHHGLFFSVRLTGAGNGGLLDGPQGEIQRRQLESFVHVFPTDLAPIVGQQITLGRASPAAVHARIQLLRERADAGECELIAKAEIAGVEAGFLYVGSARFRPDRRALPAIPDAVLQLLAIRGAPITYTCVPLGSGERLGVDRDGDGFWDGDERDARSDPADPRSTP